MKYFGNGLSEVHKELNKIIRKEEKNRTGKNTIFRNSFKITSLRNIKYRKKWSGQTY